MDINLFVLCALMKDNCGQFEWHSYCRVEENKRGERKNTSSFENHCVGLLKII